TNRHDVTGMIPQHNHYQSSTNRKGSKNALHKLTEKEKNQSFILFWSQYGHDQVFPSFITKYSNNKKTNNSGVWVKGDNGNQNENVDYFGPKGDSESSILGQSKRIVLFQCKWFDPTSRGNESLSNIISLKSSTLEQVYYAPYPSSRISPSVGCNQNKTDGRK
ncbi:hypothetical protein H5410_021812, partial [Solanum commersonii]